MNLQQLSNMQPVYDELNVVNKKVTVDNVIIEILGFTLYNKELNLYALEYDEISWAAERDAKEQGSEGPNQEIGYKVPFHYTRHIVIDEEVLEVSGSNSRRLEQYNFRDALLVNEFMRAGFHPSEIIETVDFAGIMLTQLTLTGDYDTISLPDNPKKVTLIQADSSKSFPVKKSLSLEVNKDYPHAFHCGKSENGIKFYINKVYLMDFKTEMKKTYENPEVISKMTPEELQRAKLEIAKHGEMLCPEGMLLPVIEYETEEASLEMELRQDLDIEESSSGAVVVGVIMSVDTKTGGHGLPLRAVALDAVPENTKEIDVEILSYSVTVEGKTIEI